MSYLVSCGANIWALDNDLHTPLDVAVLNDHMDIVKYLDDVIAQQSTLNKKVVRKMKEKSVLDAHKRIRKYEKIQQKAQKKAEKDEKTMAKRRLRMQTDGLIDMSGNGYLNGGVNGIAHNGNVNGTLTKKSSSGRSLSRSASITSQSHLVEPKPFSAYVNNNTKKSGVLTGVAKKIKQQKKHNHHHDTMSNGDFKIGEVEMDGKRTIRSLSGLQRDHHVMYVRNDSHGQVNGANGNREDTISRAFSEPDFNYSDGSGSGGDSSTLGATEAASMFERPGFGNVAFFRRKMSTGALMSLPSESTDIDSISVVTNGVADDTDATIRTGRVRRRGSLTDSIGTVGSLAARMKHLPWGEGEANLEDDDTQSSPLELFMSANKLTEYLQIFAREKIDLPALMLLTDSDLKEIGLPMGPRRKLLDAIARRKRSLDNPGIVMDTLL